MRRLSTAATARFATPFPIAGLSISSRVSSPRASGVEPLFPKSTLSNEARAQKAPKTQARPPPPLGDDFFGFRHVQLAICRDVAGVGRDEQLRDSHLLRTRTKRPEPNLVHDLSGFFESCPITKIVEFHNEKIALE